MEARRSKPKAVLLRRGIASITRIARGGIIRERSAFRALPHFFKVTQLFLSMGIFGVKTHKWRESETQNKPSCTF